MTSLPGTSVEVHGRKYRLCSGCGKPIFRNSAFAGENAWHYGEFRWAVLGYKAYCRHCLHYLTAKDLVHVGYDAVLGIDIHRCSFCASEDLQLLKAVKKE